MEIEDLLNNGEKQIQMPNYIHGIETSHPW